MPVVLSNPQFPNQVSASGTTQAFATQLNYRQMIQEVCGWNPSLDPMQAGRMLNNVYRKVVDMRSWYGLKVRGQIQTPSPYSQGTCTVTNGQPAVQGIGTGWTPNLVGQQFRVNFTQPYSTIVAVNATTQQLTLDMPYAGPSQTSGYMILAAYFALDGNIKRMSWAVNQMMGWGMEVNVPVETINAVDVWRTYLGWSTTFAVRPPTPAGQYQIEIWPSPFQMQVFPFEAYTQPADMQADTDCPVAWIRSDLLVTRATVDALMWRPKQNTYYDIASAIAIAREKKAEFNEAVEQMAQADNEMDQRDTSWDYSQGNVGCGAAWKQSHE
jgi:hypothetical protein